MNPQEQVSTLDKIISGLSYLTAGIVGVVYLIFISVRYRTPNKFVMFHIFQSIFLSLCYVIINWLFWTVVGILEHIPFISRLIRQIIFWFNMPIIWGYSICQCVIYGTLIYLAIFAFMGLYSYLPWVSDAIKSNFKR